MFQGLVPILLPAIHFRQGMIAAAAASGWFHAALAKAVYAAENKVSCRAVSSCVRASS